MRLALFAPLTRGERAKRAGGFTLIELMITVAILGLLASVALPFAEVAYQRTKEAELRRSLREVRAAIDAWKRAVDEGAIEKGVDKSGYPPTLQALVEGAEDQSDPERGRLYFLRRIPPDPMTGGPWGLRSYASPPEAPEKGEDVYDIYTLAEGVGLNGVPYREW